jgi:hypothetical protein
MSARITKPGGGGKSAIANASSSQVPKKITATRSAVFWWTVMGMATAEVLGSLIVIRPAWRFGLATREQQIAYQAPRHRRC